MTEEFTCPCCQGEMALHIDQKAIYKSGLISVRYERFCMKCECGEEWQTGTQRVTSHRNALRAWHNRRELMWILFLGAVMVSVVTAIFIGCS